MSFRRLGNSESEKLPDAALGNKSSIIIYKKTPKKGYQKVYVLARIAPYMSISKRKLLMNSFFISQFNCSLVWIRHIRLMTGKNNVIHENALFAVTRLHPLKNYLIQTEPLSYIQEICKYLQLKCLKFIRACRQLL